MIAFDLQCSNGHIFEGWFKDGKAYESQKAQEYIACPVCEDTSIFKVPTTFGILKKSVSNNPAQSKRSHLKADLQSGTLAKASQDQQSLIESLSQKITHFVEKNFEDVGADFAKEALKMHYGVNEPRNIKGISTAQEEKVLKEEGVNFIKFPADFKKPPESDNNSGQN